jgi:hypothetical protein
VLSWSLAMSPLGRRRAHTLNDRADVNGFTVGHGNSSRRCPVASFACFGNPVQQVRAELARFCVVRENPAQYCRARIHGRKEAQQNEEDAQVAAPSLKWCKFRSACRQVFPVRLATERVRSRTLQTLPSVSRPRRRIQFISCSRCSRNRRSGSSRANASARSYEARACAFLPRRRQRSARAAWAR